MFQFCPFDGWHPNYKQKKLISRSSYNISDVQIPPMEIVHLQFSKRKYQVSVLVEERLIKRYMEFTLEEKKPFILYKVMGRGGGMMW